MLFFAVAGMEAWKVGVCFVSKGRERMHVELTTRDVSGSLRSELYSKQSKRCLFLL